jgi:ABC-type sugar transport system ATPase subunit
LEERSTTERPQDAPDARRSVAVELSGVTKRFGEFVAVEDLTLEIYEGEFFSLLGPSGCGKTTTLRMIAGLEEPTSGRILFDGKDVTDDAPGERDIAMVFQSYALYPHMTVAENIAFPLRMSGVARPEIARLVQEAAARVRIDHLLDRRPGQLSGGQQQRCALARAIVRKPRLFLLDEPLSNLDAKLRLETRVELKSLQRNLNVTAVYVTHDQEEAMTLADRIAVLRAGRIEQVGAVGDVFRRPATRGVAEIMGIRNLLQATVVETDGATAWLDWYGARLSASSPGRAAAGAEVTAYIRPEDVKIVYPDRPWLAEGGDQPINRSMNSQEGK